MKFECVPRELCEAAKRVMRYTAVTGNKGEVAIETAKDEIVVYRNTSEAYAQCFVPANILDAGKCLAGNLNPLQFMDDAAEFVIGDSNIRVGGVSLPLSGSFLDGYTRLESAGDFVELPAEAYNTAWVLAFGDGKNNTGNIYDKTLFFDGDIVGASVAQSIFSFYKLDDVLFEKSIGIPREYVHQGALCPGTSNSIWIRDGDFSMRVQGYELQSPVKKYYEAVKKLPTIASIQVTPTIKNALAQASGFNNDYIALAYLGGDSIIVETPDSGFGYMSESKPAVVVGEQFEVIFNAQKLIKTINETEFPRLDIISNTVTMPDGTSDKRYALSAISGDGRTTNVLMESRIEYSFKFKETINV